MYGEDEVIIVADDNFLVEQRIKYGELCGSTVFTLCPSDRIAPAMEGDLEYHYE
jgi:hypothetical protein